MSETAVPGQTTARRLSGLAASSLPRREVARSSSFSGEKQLFGANEPPFLLGRKEDHDISIKLDDDEYDFLKTKSTTTTSGSDDLKNQFSSGIKLSGILLLSIGFLALFALNRGEKGFRTSNKNTIRGSYMEHHRVLAEAGITNYELLPNLIQRDHIRNLLESSGEDNLKFSLRILDTDYTIQLKRSDDLFTPEYKAERRGKNNHREYSNEKPNCIYKASILDDLDSFGSLSLCGKNIRGGLFHKISADKQFTISQLSDDMHVAFRQLDQTRASSSLSPKNLRPCGVGDQESVPMLQDIAGRRRRLTEDDTSNPTLTFPIGKKTKTVRLVIVNDAKRNSGFASSLETEHDTAAMIDLIRTFYSVIGSQDNMYGIDFVINSQITILDEDPWPIQELERGEVDSDVLLNDFYTWKMQQEDLPTNDLMPLLSGRSFLGATVGRANLGGVCTDRNVAVMQIAGFDFGLYGKIVAHELGHGLTLPHDNFWDDPLCTVDNNVYMWSGISLEDNTHFTVCSLVQLKSVFDNQLAPCLDEYDGLVNQVEATNPPSTKVPTASPGKKKVRKQTNYPTSYPSRKQ